MSQIADAANRNNARPDAKNAIILAKLRQANAILLNLRHRIDLHNTAVNAAVNNAS